MVADGRSPWCIGLESGGSNNGWPATDWVEALVLRVGGVDLYDHWAAGAIPFDHPAVRQAVAMFGQVAFGDGFVRGGADSINRLNWIDAVGPLVSDPPDCWLHLGASWDAAHPPLGSGRRGRRRLLRAAAGHPGRRRARIRRGRRGRRLQRPPRGPRVPALGPQPGMWGAVGGQPGWSVPPRQRRVRRGSMSGPGTDESVNAVRVRLCQEARDGVAAGRWRFDALT